MTGVVRHAAAPCAYNVIKEIVIINEIVGWGSVQRFFIIQVLEIKCTARGRVQNNSCEWSIMYCQIYTLRCLLLIFRLFSYGQNTNLVLSAPFFFRFIEKTKENAKKMQKKCKKHEKVRD